MAGRRRVRPEPAVDAPSGEPDAAAHGGQLPAGSAQIAVALMVMNVSMYAFTMSAARVLGPTPYGAFVAVVNAMLIVSVLQLGLQATAARRISADPEHVDEIERQILRVSFRAAVLLGAVLLAAAPVVDRLLGLGSLATALLMAVASVPLTMSGAQAGILQGERRWRELAVLYVLSGVPRLVVGLALVLWQPTQLMAFLGLAVGFVAPYLYGLTVLRRGRRGRDARARGDGSHPHGFVPVMRETARSSQALLAFFALTNADMLVARTVLDPGDSGLYAAGVLVARAVLFLPQSVVVLAFPSMSAEDGAARALGRSVAAVVVLGALCTAATAVLPDVVLVLAGGGAYAAVRDQLWLFAALGTVMAVLQLLVYSVLARQGRHSVHLVWAALALMLAGATTVSSVTGLLAVVLLADTVLLMVLGVLAHVTARGRVVRRARES